MGTWFLYKNLQIGQGLHLLYSNFNLLFFQNFDPSFFYCLAYYYQLILICLEVMKLISDTGFKPLSRYNMTALLECLIVLYCIVKLMDHIQIVESVQSPSKMTYVTTSSKQ